MLTSRLTPAFAGTTASTSRWRYLTWADPRVRGDHHDACVERARAEGSPPRSRGPHAAPPPRRADGRLTPAFAGTTPQRGPLVPIFRAHPRVRGDHPIVSSIRDMTEGSPPRSRGPRHGVGLLGVLGRLTPAFAGTTSVVLMPHPQRPAHPRVRGDHSCGHAEVYAAMGSPPRSRGPPSTRSGASSDGRLTPAFAGTTTRKRTSTRKRTAHPRVRGDHCVEANRAYLRS